MNVAALDIGTNTVLLLIARIDDAGTLTPLVVEQRAPRLGSGVDRAGNLNPEAVGRVLDVLRAYREIINGMRPDAVVACATSAVRDAANREQFLEQARAAAGTDIEVLSGTEEALRAYRGAVSGLTGIRNATVLDIGGGSTEVTTGTGGDILASASLDVGAVRLTERYFRHDPPLPGEIAQATECVRTALSRPLPVPPAESTLIGVAGTATALAVLDQRLPHFTLEAVAGYTLRRDSVQSLFGMLSHLPARRIRELSSVMEGRADVIPAGTLILREVMAHLGFASMVVSERGVRYGLALRAWERRRAEQRSSLSERGAGR